MRWLMSAVLYTALCVSANADVTAAEALREGDMKKLVFHSTPQPVSDEPFFTAGDEPTSLSAYRGQHLVVNFWATWCAPCRKEMPMLSNLQTHFADAPVEVVTIATGRNPLPAMKRFFEEIDVDNLPLYRDPKQKLAREMAVLGLPITVIIDPDGNEIARLRGDAIWDSPSAIAVIEALLPAES